MKNLFQPKVIRPIPTPCAVDVALLAVIKEIAEQLKIPNGQTMKQIESAVLNSFVTIQRMRFVSTYFGGVWRADIEAKVS